MNVHALQIGVTAGLDDLETAAEKAALAVNRYLDTVELSIGVETEVVVSIGSMAPVAPTYIIEQSDDDDEPSEEGETVGE